MVNGFLNLESILDGEKTFNSLKEMFAHPSNELYLCSALHELSKMNSSIKDLNARNFKSILEAETKTAENQQFCTYFKEFKAIIDRFIGKIDEMAGKAIINIDNIADANKELIENDLMLSNFSPFDMEVYEYHNLTDKEVPKFKAKKFFKKDFDHIGTLMQDLGPIASDEAKLKIIASVYNSLKKDMEEDFLEKCAEKMLDDDYDKKESMPAQVNKLFKDEKEQKTIDKSDVQEAKAILMNIPVYTDVIRSMADQLIEDFTEIANSLGDMIFRNKSYTLKIDTETDGIKNKEYELNTYSMNQFNIFMKTKSVQVSQICNMYMVAFSIKLDNIVEFINQNKEILNMAQESSSFKSTKYNDDNTVDPEEDNDATNEPSSDEEEDIYSSTEKEEEDIYDADDSSESEDDEDNDVDDAEIENPEEENPDSEDTVKENNEFELESYYFEYEMFNLERMFEQEQLKCEFDAILEADGDTQSGTQTVGKMANANSTKAVDIWRAVVEKIQQLFDKFNDIFIKHTSARIKYLKNHTSEINSNNFANDATIKPYFVDRLEDLNVKDLNYQTMKDDLVSKEKFIQKYYSNIKVDENTSFSQAIKKYISPEDVSPIKTIGKDKMLQFCTTYPAFVNQIKQDKNNIDKAQQNAKRIAESIAKAIQAQQTQNNDQNNNNNNQQKTGTANESYIYTADDLYFDEAFNPGSGGNGGEAGSIRKQLMVYFSVSSQVLSNKMSLANSAFNEYYRALFSLTNNKGDAPNTNNDNNNKK